MVEHQLPSGLHCFYEWALIDGLEWRVVKHWTNEGDAYRFDYDLQAGTTRITDSLQRVSTRHWNSQHQITLTATTSAGSGIGTGANHIETTVATLAASGSADGVFVTETDGLSVAGVVVNVNRIDSTDTITTTGYAPVSDLVTTSGGSIVLVSTAGDITITDGVDVDINGLDGSGNVLLNAAAGSINLQTGLTSRGSNISILANINISQSAAASDISTSGSGTIDIEAVTGSISMVDGAVTSTSGNGNIRYNAATTVTVGSISTSGDVSLRGTAITDSGTAEIDIMASGLRLQASTQAGESFNHLETSVNDAVR